MWDTVRLHCSRNGILLQGTHADIEYAALHFLRLRGVRLPMGFLMLRTLGVVWSPDVRWFLGRFKASWSRYNPQTGQGCLPNKIESTIAAITSLSPSRTFRRLASLATLAHLAVDASDPAHYEGISGQQTTRFWWYTISNDWYDPATGSLRDPRELHNHFERSLARLAPLRLGQPEFVATITPLYDDIRRLLDHNLVEGIITYIQTIHERGLWTAYRRHRFTPALAHTLQTWLLPRAIAFVAALWVIALTRLPPDHRKG